MPSKIATSADFKKHVVDRDYADYKRNPTDLRLAYHLALSLFHLRDWTFWEHSGAPHWPYSGSQGGYQGNLESLCSDFGYIRDLANSVKHAELDPKQKPSTQMVGLANTEISSAANATHIRRIVVWEKPVSVAIERIDQCVASTGVVRNVRSITAAT